MSYLCPRPYRYPMPGGDRWAVNTNQRSRSYRWRWVAEIVAYCVQRGKGNERIGLYIRRREREARRVERVMAVTRKHRREVRRALRRRREKLALLTQQYGGNPDRAAAEFDGRNPVFDDRRRSTDA